MNAPRQYATARAFRTALEARLLDFARRENTDLQRLLFSASADRWPLTACSGTS